MRVDPPLRVDPIFKKLQEERRRQREQHTTRDQERAERIAWRQLLRWVEAQLAMVDLGMAQDAEVFMAYAVKRASIRLSEWIPSSRNSRRSDAGNASSILPGIRSAPNGSPGASS